MTVRRCEKVVEGITGRTAALGMLLGEVDTVISRRRTP